MRLAVILESAFVSREPVFEEELPRLWVALRCLREEAAFSIRVAARARKYQLAELATAYEVRARDAHAALGRVERTMASSPIPAAADDAFDGRRNPAGVPLQPSHV